MFKKLRNICVSKKKILRLDNMGMLMMALQNMRNLPLFRCNTLLLVTEAIDIVMTGEGIDDKDLVISKLLREDIQKCRSLFPHVSKVIQSKKYPLKGDTIQYIYTNSKHNNPLRRVTSIENKQSLPSYDKVQGNGT